MKVTIYHNPRCTKSRETLALLRARGIEPTVIEYLKEPPDVATLARLVALLGISPRELLRTQEAPYAELGLGAPGVSDRVILRAMAENPILIERPIVVAGGKARLGRPPERVLEIVS